MKIRLDFVTNSSSSSFILGIKGELIEEKLLEVFKVDPSSPLYPFTKELVNFIVTKGKRNKIEIQEVIEDYGSIEDAPDSYRDIINKGMDIYRVSASNESDGIELALYNMVINHISEDLIIESEY